MNKMLHTLKQTFLFSCLYSLMLPAEAFAPSRATVQSQKKQSAQLKTKENLPSKNRISESSSDNTKNEINNEVFILKQILAHEVQERTKENIQQTIQEIKSLEEKKGHILKYIDEKNKPMNWLKPLIMGAGIMSAAPYIASKTGGFLNYSANFLNTSFLGKLGALSSVGGFLGSFFQKIIEYNMNTVLPFTGMAMIMRTTGFDINSILNSKKEATEEELQERVVDIDKKIENLKQKLQHQDRENTVKQINLNPDLYKKIIEQQEKQRQQTQQQEVRGKKPQIPTPKADLAGSVKPSGDKNQVKRPTVSPNK